MRPNSIEYRKLLREDERLRRFKESEWERLGHGDPRGMIIECIVFSIPIIGQSLLLIFLLFEWFYKLWRMLSISAKAFYFYSTKIFRK